MTEIDALGAYTPGDTNEIKEQELWSLDATFTDYILPRIKAFRKMKRHGYPSGVIDVSASDGVGVDEANWAVVESNQEEREVAEWENILHDIENAFQLLKDVDCSHDRTKAQHEVITKGLGLFAKYYEHLWD